ncbi:M20/M25/M40 family metallo-hydrolase [Microbacterium aurantiacum]|uniref:Zn-dependent M28 family amino/carboxypeptidase n=1 Tax=Microbacterium aurantiacum TaxID=162393 RepID=A0A0N0RRM8_9MICO|nr:M20/M25/M40 family metallo-hydrolase [Microbacterium chocolatum]KOS11595.1 hypothetical protein XI38_03230 [Microbacterium chocolatum]
MHKTHTTNTPSSLSSRRARTLAVVTAVGLLGGGALAQPAWAAVPEGPTEHTTLGLTGAQVMTHLAELAEISESYADEGYRTWNGPGYEASAAYVEQAIEATGAFTVERQVFTVDDVIEGPVTVTVGGVALVGGHMINAEGTAEPLVGAPLAAPAEEEGGRLGCDPASFTDIPAGSVVVVQRGVCAFGDKVANATAVDAAAVLIANNAPGLVENGTVGDRNTSSAPAASLTPEDGAVLFDLIAAAQGAEQPAPTADVVIEKEFVAVPTFNVIAESIAGDPEDVVVIGAHLDGVDAGPGVNDNASGSAALLALADQVAAYEFPNDRKIRLAFWGAEEIGLLGSTHYVTDLAENDPAALERISAYLNYDMIGSDNYTVGVYDADQSTFEAPVTVPEGSIALEAIFTDFFDGVEQPWVDSEFSGRSDYQAFIEAGIPAGGLFSGADTVKTEEEAAIFGGTAGEPLDSNYHRPTDTLENVNRESVDAFAPAIGWAAHVLAWELVDAQPPVSPEPTDPAVPSPEPEPTGPGAEPTTEPVETVTPAPAAGSGRGDLATTGGSSVAPFALAAGVLLMGGVVVSAFAASRHRRTRSES